MKKSLGPSVGIPTPEKDTIEAVCSRSSMLPRILPFAVFMAFIGVDELLGLLSKYGIFQPGEYFPFVLYPLKALTTAGALLFFRFAYSEIRFRDILDLRNSTISLALGLVVFVAWINLDYSFGADGKGFDPTIIENGFAKWLTISIRLAGASVIVPIMEELFWRSFLIRYIIGKDFDAIPIGTFTAPSFLLCSVLFGLEHQFIIAGIVAGIVYNFLLYYTKSIAQCILSHAATNLALGVYVLSTGQWRFW